MTATVDDATAYKIDPLNAIRVFAVFIVFLLHTYIFSDYTVTGGLDILFKTPAWAGVWIFFIIGGFLAEKGFIEGRYKFTIKGIAEYYITRIIKILLPTFLFIFIICVSREPNFIHNYPEVIIQFLTLTYNGSPGVTGIGATWYVFTIMWLYFLTPFFTYVVYRIDNKVKNKKFYAYLILCSIIVIGLAYRLSYYYNINNDWYEDIYTFPLSEIDLFFSGIVLNYVCRYRINLNKIPDLIIKILSLCLIIVVFISNCWVYYKTDTDVDYLILYRYVYPTLWLVSVAIFIIAFYKNRPANPKPTAKMMFHHPISMIDLIAAISLEFYLWHSVIDDMICQYIPVYFGIPTSDVCGHIIFLITACILTIIFAYMANIVNQAMIKKLLTLSKNKLHSTK